MLTRDLSRPQTVQFADNPAFETSSATTSTVDVADYLGPYAVASVAGTFGSSVVEVS